MLKPPNKKDVCNIIGKEIQVISIDGGSLSLICEGGDVISGEHEVFVINDGNVTQIHPFISKRIELTSLLNQTILDVNFISSGSLLVLLDDLKIEFRTTNEFEGYSITTDGKCYNV